MTLHSSTFQILSHILVSIIHQCPLCCCVCSAATCDWCSTLWLLHILAVDTHMTDSVTHNDKVISTKDGQQTGPTLTINHVGGWLLFIIAKWKCEQKIQHNSVPSELKPVVWCWPPYVWFWSMYWKHNVHTIMLENSFQQQQGCTNHLWQVARSTIFCAAVPWCWWVLSVELPSHYKTGAWNFKLPSRFLQNLCILEWHYSKSSLCHVKCILSKLICNILTFWMVQDSCCNIYIYIYGKLSYLLYVLYWQ
jgi:hypothetical protein